MNDFDFLSLSLVWFFSKRFIDDSQKNYAQTDHRMYGFEEKKFSRKEKKIKVSFL